MNQLHKKHYAMTRWSWMDAHCLLILPNHVAVGEVVAVVADEVSSLFSSCILNSSMCGDNGE